MVKMFASSPARPIRRTPKNRFSRLDFRFAIRLYQIFGGCPTTLCSSTSTSSSISSTSRRFFALFTILHLLIVTAQTVVVLFYFEEAFRPYDFFVRVNDTIRWCGLGFAYYAIVIESYAHRRRHATFWQRAASLQKQNTFASPNTTGTMQQETSVLCLETAFVLKVVSFTALASVLEATLMPVIVLLEPQLRLWSMLRYSLVVCRLRHFQFVHYAGVVERELCVVAERLRYISVYAQLERSKQRQWQTADTPPRKSSASFNLAADAFWRRFLQQRLRWAQLRYTQLYDMADDVNAMFGWSQLANCLQVYVQMVVDMYWVYWRYFDGESSPLIAYLTTYMPSLFVLVCVFHKSNQCTLQAKKVNVMLFGIKKWVVDESLSAQVCCSELRADM